MPEEEIFKAKTVKVEHGYFEKVHLPLSDRYHYDAFPDPGYRFCGWFHDDTLYGTEQSMYSDSDGMTRSEPEFLPEYPFEYVLTGYETTYSVGIIFKNPDVISSVELTAMNVADKKTRSTTFRPGNAQELIIRPGEYKLKSRITTSMGFTYRTVERVRTHRKITALFRIDNPGMRTYAGDFARIIPEGLALTMYQKWYYKYRNLPVRRYYSQPEMIDLLGYLTTGDQVLADLAKALGAITAGMDRWDRADAVLRFVQGIRSRSDLITTGCEDYFKLPAETLWDNAGDCEDKVILLLSLLKLMGFRTVFHICDIRHRDSVTKHVAAGVLVEPRGGTTNRVNGEEYVFCDPTLLSGRKGGLGKVPKGCFVSFSRAV